MRAVEAHSFLFGDLSVRKETRPSHSINPHILSTKDSLFPPYPILYCSTSYFRRIHLLGEPAFRKHPQPWMRQAYSLHIFRMPSPRALPWATVSKPVGLEGMQGLCWFSSQKDRSPFEPEGLVHSSLGQRPRWYGINKLQAESLLHKNPKL